MRPRALSSTCRASAAVWWGPLLVLALLCGTPTLHAQQPLDRILARVAGHPITLTDLVVARSLGIVQPGAEESAEASMVRQLIERRLLTLEVMRAPAREPTAEAVDAEVARLLGRVTGSYAVLLQSTGYDEAGVRDLALETLRIEAYIRQRFGPRATQADMDVRTWVAELRGRAQVDVVGQRK